MLESGKITLQVCYIVGSVRDGLSVNSKLMLLKRYSLLEKN